MIPAEAIAFLCDLLRTPSASIDHVIGAEVWGLTGGGSREDVMDCVTRWMTVHRPGSRGFEVAYDIWLLLGGSAAAA